MPVRAATQVDHKVRIGLIQRYLDDHLDEPVSLASLARMAAYANHHFHRVFRGVTGESVAGYVRRLKLERAARRVLTSNAPLTAIAQQAGYSTPDAFTRAFTQAFDVAPTEFRTTPRRRMTAAIEGEPGRPEPALPLVEIRAVPEIKIVSLRHRAPSTAPRTGLHGARARHVGQVGKLDQGSHVGEVGEMGEMGELGELGELGEVTGRDPNELVDPFGGRGATFERLMRTAVRDVRVVGASPSLYGLSHDDPDMVGVDKVRFDACFSLENSAVTLPKGDGVHLSRIPAGSYAIAVHSGSLATIADTYLGLIGLWLPTTRFGAADEPIVEAYLDDPTTTPADQRRTEVRIRLG